MKCRARIARRPIPTAPGRRIKPAGRLVFAHQLRRVTALLIVITHCFGTFYGAQGFVPAVTFSPDLHLAAADRARYVSFPYLKDPFGVATFS